MCFCAITVTGNGSGGAEHRSAPPLVSLPRPGRRGDRCSSTGSAGREGREDPVQSRGVFRRGLCAGLGRPPFGLRPPGLTGSRSTSGSGWEPECHPARTRTWPRRVWPPAARGCGEGGRQPFAWGCPRGRLEVRDGCGRRHTRHSFKRYRAAGADTTTKSGNRDHAVAAVTGRPPSAAGSRRTPAGRPSPAAGCPSPARRASATGRCSPATPGRAAKPTPPCPRRPAV